MTDLFATFPPELLQQLEGRTTEARYRRGDVIFEKGDQANNLFVVLSGRVAIVARASDGRESVISVLGPGALFGEMSLFNGGGRPPGRSHYRILARTELEARTIV